MKVTVVTRPAPYGVSEPTGEFVEIESLVGSLSAKNGLRIRGIPIKSMNQKMIDGYTDVMEINGLSLTPRIWWKSDLAWIMILILGTFPTLSIRLDLIDLVVGFKERMVNRKIT